MNRRRIQRPGASVLLAIGMVLVAANLRPAAAGIGPLIDRIKSDTGLSDGGADILVALPVFCFGALAPLAPALARRFGSRSAIAGALVLLLLGLLVRLLPGLAFLFVGTAIAGAAIAVANVLLPVLVRSNFAERVGIVTGIYSTALIGFAALAAGVSVPVADAFGGGWRPGLAIWAVPAAVTMVVWAPQLARARRVGAMPGDEVHGARSLLHDKVAWAVTLFFAIQSAGFYSTLAWLPSVFHAHGASTAHAGLLLSISLVVGLIPSLTVPAMAARVRDQRAFVCGFVACIAAGWIGVIVAPMGAPYLWVVLLGLGQNAAFPLALTLIVLRGGTVTSTAALSTLVQTVGYMIAAVAPFAIGAVHDITGSWTPALFVLLGLLVPQLIVGLAAARNRTVAPIVR
ncbi:MAG TPA: MFS transporter [Solirubrobacteraceae bacterium]|nr:MFS transporter [Solirubrobacteraceae bacterium]